MSLPSFLYPGELEVAVFPFADRLEPGETIATVEVVSVISLGTDAAPEAVLVGAPIVDASNVLHRIVGTVPGVRYNLVAKATTSTGRIPFVLLPLRCVPLSA
jgi:hypothetical protein